jgi:hypothetical protein
VKPQTRIVVVAIANGRCGAVPAVSSVLRIVSVDVAVAIAIAVMGATWVLLCRAILDKQTEDARRERGSDQDAR